jgi:hypothetical protein
MIALFSLPGSSLFKVAYCRTRAEGEAWLARCAQPETQATLVALRQSRVISDREAAKLRWRDGSRIVDDNTRTVASWDERDAECAQ